jgi:hypothetical protein
MENQSQFAVDGSAPDYWTLQTRIREAVAAVDQSRVACRKLSNAVCHLRGLCSADAYADYQAVQILEKLQFEIIRGEQ